MAQGDGKKQGSNVGGAFRKAAQPVVDGVSSVLTFVGDGRIKVLCGVFLAVAAIFLARLLFLQVIMADTYSAMAEESRTISFTTTPRRGTIYDRNGLVLATSVEAKTIYANPAEVTDADAAAQKLADILGGEKEDYKKKLTLDETTFVYLKRQADLELANRVKDQQIDGVYFIDDTRREYPNGAIGGQVIGFCNVDGEGITGLELQYDEILKGTPGVYVAERGETGTPIPGGVREQTPAQDGEDIVISLDVKLQEVVENRLKEEAERLSTESGSAVVMDGDNGEIYAICSLPYMDPTNMEESEKGSDQVAAITQVMEPGSVFKTVTALSVREHDVMSAEDVLFCPATLKANDYEVSDARERGDTEYSLREIIAKSSNVGISLAAEKLGFSNLYEAILKYNLTERTGVDYPGEMAGYLQDFNNWGRIVGYNVSFGQGISVTPLQMVRFYGALANGGIEVTPHFLMYKPQSDERPVYAVERVCFDEQAMEDTISMLRSVVTDGTGKAADVPNYEVVGKTSTAEIASSGTYLEDTYNLCFAGFIAHSSSKLVTFMSANNVGIDSSVTGAVGDIMSHIVEQYNVVQYDVGQL